MAEQLPMVRMSLLIGQRSAIAISKYKHNSGILTGKERQTAGRDMEKENVILELRGIKKSFGEVHALKNANFSLRKGEIHSIIGENGAGKSTLMKIISGVYTADEGTIEYDGETYRNLTSKQAIDIGIGIVHQEFMLVRELSVIENIILGKEPKKSLSRIDFSKAAELLNTYIDDYGFDIRLNKKVRDIPVGEAQRVEIVKTLYRGAQVMILDEPTAVLTPQETKLLFNVIRRLQAAGTSIIFISHKLNEVMEISDRITIMRAGETVATVEKQETDKNKLAALMLGRAAFVGSKHVEREVGDDVALRVEGIYAPGDRELSKIRNMSFSVKKGEILGIAGVDGNGQTELAEALIGLRKLDAGEIYLNGEKISALDVKQHRAKHIGYIPEDRNTRGLWQERTIRENLAALPLHQKQMAKFGIIDRKAVTAYGETAAERFDIRPRGIGHICRGLSGGNAQKVVVAREMSQPLTVLIASQPTRGVDIGSIESIHAMIRKAADEGTSVVLISTELEEILSLSDRVVVLYEGQIAGEVDAGNTSEEELGLLMTGGSRAKGDAQ